MAVTGAGALPYMDHRSSSIFMDLPDPNQLFQDRYLNRRTGL